MASLPIESPFTFRPPLSRVGIGAAMFAAFLVYCEMHGVIGWEAVPLIVSARWALAATFAWGLLLLIGWECRHRLRAAASGPLRAKALFLLAVAVPIALADLAAMELTSLLNAGEPLADPLRRAWQFVPRAAMLACILLLALALWEHHIAPARDAAPAEPWLDFPESPLLRLRAADIALIRSAGNYSEIVNGGRTYLIRATLSDLADRLAPHGFVRVHRQTIVNAAQLREICRDPAGRAVAHLAAGQRVPIGRSYLDAIDALTRG